MIHSKAVSSSGVTTNRSGVFRDLLIFRRSLLKNASVYVTFVHAVNKVSNGAPTTHRIPGKDVKLLESTASVLSHISYVKDATSFQDQDGPQEDVKCLFDSKHVPRWTPSLIMYYPFGLVIALFRMSLWICGILLDATWFRSPAVISAYLTILGFRSQWYHTGRLPTDRHVLVSNHVMPGDLMVLFQGLPQRYVHLITTGIPTQVVSAKNLPCDLRYATPEVYEQLAASDRTVQHYVKHSSADSTQAVGPALDYSSVTPPASSACHNFRAGESYSHMPAPPSSPVKIAAHLAVDMRDEDSSTSKKQCTSIANSTKIQNMVSLDQLSYSPHTPETLKSSDFDPPIHLFPEGGVTNGRWGMMQFSRGFMRLLRPGEYVVPVVLRAKTPWDIRTHTLTSSFLANLFWISFCPWVEVHATVLPPLRPTVGESKAAFVRRVQSSIAEASGLVISELNISAKRRLMKQS